VLKTVTRAPDVRDPLAAALVAAAAMAWLFTGDFGKEVLSEVAVFAIFAMSLDLLVGCAGLVSLGHAAFFALGAYAVAAFGVFVNLPMWMAMPLAVAVTAVAAAAAGFFAVRLGGVFFIMMTLAIGQMVYAFFLNSRAFNADDGMAGIGRVDFSFLALDSGEPAVFSAFAVCAAVAVFLLLRMVARSPFGHTLAALRRNEPRLRSLGCPVLRCKLAAFTLAGALAGFAGALAAQHNGFISPDLAFWTVSGEVLVMVIVGGMGSLSGAALGAALVILLRHHLAGLTEFWVFYLGVLFVLMVLFAEGGVAGMLSRLPRKLHRRGGNV